MIVVETVLGETGLPWEAEGGVGGEGRQTASARRQRTASAAIAGRRRLFLREAQQLLSDGLDQGGGGMRGRRNVPLRGQIPHAGGVQVGGRSCTPVHLEEKRSKNVEQPRNGLG